MKWGRTWILFGLLALFLAVMAVCTTISLELLRGMKLDATNLTAWGTLTLALIAAISIAVNVALAWSTWLYAKAAKDQVAVEKEQLALFQRQLALAESQFAAAQYAAKPKLRAFLDASSSEATGGGVTYLHGTEPAYAVEVWIRGVPQTGEEWGLRFAEVGVVVPRSSDTELTFTAWPATTQEQSRLPLPNFFDQPLDPGECLVGLTWKRSDGTVDNIIDKQVPPKQ